ncbi:Signal transduction histidine kinase [Aquimarina amphilecti]|uniref:Signal transduction histidine kinase n=1 Tax=Aquimarina amphilecti TaxID=1038014 RepID=A0A1H7WRE7_AQUAM|nr:tetratricopeptide repeat-containing sensor histidine kinase [Aquimarina amphilecti]SEM24096.1 Signal transduction histidine kinase [Aquimarina amphilecti]
MKLFVKFLFLFSILFVVSCDRGIDLAEKSNEFDLKSGMIQNYLEEAKNKNNTAKERRSSLENAYAITSSLDDNSFKANQILQITLQYYHLKDLENFKKFNDKTLEISTDVKDSIIMARSYFLNGVYYRKDDLTSAYRNFYEAEKIYLAFEESGIRDPKSYAYDYGKILTDLAKISQKVKDYSKSEDFTIRAIEKFKLAENLKYLPVCYTNLGILAKYLERYDDAVTYHELAIESAKNTEQETLRIIISYNNIGTVYKSQNKFEEAKKYYNKALSYQKILEKTPSRYARLLDNLAYVHFLADDEEIDVLGTFYKALWKRDSINDLAGISTNSLHLAEYYKVEGNDSLANHYGQRAKNTSIEIGNNEELLRSYKLLSEITDSKTGLEYTRTYIKLSDSLVKEERAFRDKFSRIEFETAEKTKEIAAISRENQYLIFAILGLSVLSLLGYVIFKQQQSNKELLFEQNQQQSNQEIYRLLLSQQLKLEEGRKLEQHRMSEELHDGVLGRLFGVRLSLDGINQRANDGFTDARNKYIDELKSIEREIRLISHDLGTETLSPDIAYVDVVESLVSDLCTVHKMDFAFANDENIDWETVDDQKKVNLFRIIQESLQNIFKHARAKSVKINFDYVDDKINLTILDDGIGFKSSKVKRGIGLKNITSRVTQMDGVVDFISNQDSGTKVSVGIPI